MPEDVKAIDPHRAAKVCFQIDGKRLKGIVDDIEIGAITKTKLYLIKYEDSDSEHFTEDRLVASKVGPWSDVKASCLRAFDNGVKKFNG